MQAKDTKKLIMKAKDSENLKISSSSVKAMRESIGWSQIDLAEKTGLSLSTIRRIEKTTENASIPSIKLIDYTFQEHGVTYEEQDGQGVIRFPLDKEG